MKATKMTTTQMILIGVAGSLLMGCSMRPNRRPPQATALPLDTMAPLTPQEARTGAHLDQGYDETPLAMDAPEGLSEPPEACDDCDT